MLQRLLILYCLILPLISSCSSTKPVFVSGKWQEGWVDNNTYRIISTASAQGRSTEVMLRRRACQAAQMNAMAKAIEALAGSGSKMVQGTVKIEEVREGIRKNLSGTIKGGRVTARRTNVEKGTCTVAYEITERNLRLKVERASREAVKSVK